MPKILILTSKTGGGHVSLAEALRQTLGIEQWTLLSYSAGTRAAEAYLRRDPARVRRSVFLCPACLSRRRALVLRLLLRLDVRWPRASAWALSGWRLRVLAVWFGFNGRRHPYAADWAEEVGAQPLAGLKTALRELPDRLSFRTPGSPTLYV